MAKMLEVRWHGRGGMGAVTAGELLAKAAIREGKYAQSFPNFGTERRGAPVMAFLRISDELIRIRTNIYNPDVVVVLDPTLFNIVDVAAGLKDDGVIIINSSKPPEYFVKEQGSKYRIATVNATKIARESIGLPITNTSMIGAFMKVTEAVGSDSMGEELKEHFGKRADGNIVAMKQAYSETVIKE
jgi:pyruvate ferredoxin oxidoreductase gamma subunit